MYFPSRRFLFSRAFLAILLAPIVRLTAADVSREPPALYKEHLEALLTPVEDVLAGTAPGTDGDDGVVLLSEEINYVAEDGVRYVVRHFVGKALTDAGAKALATDTWTYRKSEERIHLVLARTLEPDGTRTPVQPNAALIQSPQKEGGAMLYSDRQELHLIFPRVKAGTVTESIVVIEELAPRIPGEFTGIVWLSPGWAVARLREVVELPEALAARLRIQPLGTGVPAVEKSAPRAGRRRFVWETGSLPAGVSEPKRAPADQVGPVVWLTTLAGWEDFAKWYGGLLAERDSLEPELAEKVDLWTKEAKTPREILDVLFDKTANDVRYTGLEFGKASLQPYDADSVWQNQYGDCKDKANLLRVMLARKGIKSSLVLLNTNHAGRIEMASPDYRQFDHAILAVELGEEVPLFCDPTIEQARPGELSPGDADRDVLLVSPGAWRWAHTPPQHAGTLTYDFDLTLGADGDLAGWFTLRSEGVYGAFYSDYYVKLEKTQVRSKLAGTIGDFFPGAQVVDTVCDGARNDAGRYEAKAYFVVSGANQRSLRFPSADWLYPSLGTNPKRVTPYFQWRDTTRVEARIKLPSGLAGVDLPAPYALETDAVRARAGWSRMEDGVRAEITFEAKQSVVPPGKYEAMRQALLSLRSWLDKPALLGAAEPAAPRVPEPPAEPLADFPMMPTGEGQLELLAKRYPPEGDERLRRAALERTRQYFPHDKPTLFETGVHLAMLGWDEADEEKNAAMAAEIARLLETYRRDARAWDRAWAEYVRGLALKKAGQEKEAVAVLASLAEDPSAPEYRRAWGAWQVADMLEEKDPERALTSVRTAVALDTVALPAGFELLARMLLAGGRGPELAEELRALLERQPEELEKTLERLAGSTANLEPERGAELLAILEKAKADGSAIPDAVLATARTAVGARANRVAIRGKLQEYLSKNPLPPLPDPVPQPETREALVKAIDAAEKTEKSPERALRLALDLLVRFEPEGDFAHYLWKAAIFAEWKEKREGLSGPLSLALLDLCDLLPPSDDYYVEGRVVRAKQHQRLGSAAQAAAIYEALLAQPELNPDFLGTLAKELGRARESLHDYAAAARTYERLEEEMEKYPAAPDALFRAALIHFSLGETDRAIALLRLLAEHAETVKKNAACATQALELAAFVADETRARAYWKWCETWWPLWEKFEADSGETLPEGAREIPAIEDLLELGGELGTAMRMKDRAAFLGKLRTVAHAARLHPSMRLEFAELASTIMGFLPEKEKETRELVVAMTDGREYDVDEARRRQLAFLHVAHLFDAGRAPEAATAAEKFLAEKGERDAAWVGVLRIQALAAQKSTDGREDIAKTMENVISSGIPVPQRALFMYALAGLYRALDRPADELALLTRELARPDVQTEKENASYLQQRLDQLSQNATNAEALTAGVARWLEKVRPPWFEFAEPKSLDDPRLDDLDATMKNPEEIFQPAEVIKFYLLVAQSPEQPFERRAMAIDNALYHMISRTRTHTEASAVSAPLIADEELPEEIRTRALWFAIYAAGRDFRAAETRRLAALPLAEKFTGVGRKNTAELVDFAATDINSVEAIEQAAAKRLKGEMAWLEREDFLALHRLLTRRGALEAADRLYKKIAGVRVAAGEDFSKSSLQLEALRTLKLAREWEPAQAALCRIALEAMPAGSRPPRLDTLRNPDELDWLPREEAQAIQLYQMSQRTFDATGLGFWSAFIRNLDEQWTLRQQLAETAMTSAPGDDGKIAAVFLVRAVLDSDDPAQREFAEKLLAPYRDDPAYPACGKMIRVTDVQLALRLGQPPDFAAAFAGTAGSPVAAMEPILKLQHYLVANDLPALRRTLRATATDRLLRQPLLPLAIRAFRAAGVEDEAMLAGQTAAEEIPRALLSAWAGLDFGDFNSAVELADAAKIPEAIPADFEKNFLARIENKRLQDRTRLLLADLRHDWKGLAREAELAIADEPRLYSNYWYLGSALYHLDRKAEAVKPLETFVRYCHNELDYAQAVEWLRELKNES